MMSILSNLSGDQFLELKSEDMTLIHHAAFDGNVDAVGMMTSLPYFKDVVNCNNNEVGYINIK